jgi:hypothetical protein
MHTRALALALILTTPPLYSADLPVKQVILLAAAPVHPYEQALAIKGSEYSRSEHRKKHPVSPHRIQSGLTCKVA